MTTPAPSGARILVVDDVPENVRLLEAVLTPHGSNGFAACGDSCVGAVTNLASRLADEAAGGQVLITERLFAEVETEVDVDSVGEFTLKGFQRPVAAYDLLRVRD